jgi:hypothetical protein
MLMMGKRWQIRMMWGVVIPKDGFPSGDILVDVKELDRTVALNGHGLSELQS